MTQPNPEIIAMAEPSEELLWRIARNLSVPEHHTTWDLLTERQKDLYFMQAQYAYSTIQPQLEKMREALKEYGSHMYWCDWISAGDPDLAKCECGWLEKRRELGIAPPPDALEQRED